LGDGFEGDVGLAEEFDAVVEGSQKARDFSLLINGGNQNPEMGDVLALQTVEHSTDINVGAYLRPPLCTANKPTQVGRVDALAVCPQHDQILTNRAFESLRNNGGHTRVAAANHNDVIRLRTQLSSPVGEVFSRDPSHSAEIDAAILQLRNCDVRIARLGRSWGPMITIN